MSVLELTLLLALGSLLAGLLGALSGLGGGVVIVPLLTLVFGVDIRYAIGASLLSVIATSSGAAAAYVKEGYSNIRGGMLLEVLATLRKLQAEYLIDLDDAVYVTKDLAGKLLWWYVIRLASCHRMLLLSGHDNPRNAG
jgi:Sulfite exporter TauE/SafE